MRPPAACKCHTKRASVCSVPTTAGNTLFGSFAIAMHDTRPFTACEHLQMKQEAACSRVDGLVDQMAALQDEVSSLQVGSLTSLSMAEFACYVMLPACLL